MILGHNHLLQISLNYDMLQVLWKFWKDVLLKHTQTYSNNMLWLFWSWNQCCAPKAANPKFHHKEFFDGKRLMGGKLQNLTNLYVPFPCFDVGTLLAPSICQLHQHGCSIGSFWSHEVVITHKWLPSAKHKGVIVFESAVHVAISLHASIPRIRAAEDEGQTKRQTITVFISSRKILM